MATTLETPTLEAVIAADRERLSNERAQIWDQMKELEDRLAQIERQMTAIKLYEDALHGKVPTAQPAQARAPRAPRQRRGGVRDELLKRIREEFDGQTSRADLLRSMNIDEKTPEGKRAAQSVSNALSALVKSQQLVREGREYRTP